MTTKNGKVGEAPAAEEAKPEASPVNAALATEVQGLRGLNETLRARVRALEAELLRAEASALARYAAYDVDLALLRKFASETKRAQAEVLAPSQAPQVPPAAPKT